MNSSSAVETREVLGEGVRATVPGAGAAGEPPAAAARAPRTRGPRRPARPAGARAHRPAPAGSPPETTAGYRYHPVESHHVHRVEQGGDVVEREKVGGKPQADSAISWLVGVGCGTWHRPGPARRELAGSVRPAGPGTSFRRSCRIPLLVPVRNPADRGESGVQGLAAGQVQVHQREKVRVVLVLVADAVVALVQRHDLGPH